MDVVIKTAPFLLRCLELAVLNNFKLNGFLKACWNRLVGASAQVCSNVLHLEKFLVLGDVRNIDNEPRCASLTRSDSSSLSFAKKKTNKCLNTLHRRVILSRCEHSMNR